MRILVANDGFGDGGGVQSYLEAVVGGLVSRGHDVAMFYCDPVPHAVPRSPMNALPHFSIQRDGLDVACDAAARWRPEICLSNNMSDLVVERRLLATAPVVKFMHGYNGTCISGHKRFGSPVVQPCDRIFGAACVALYFPRRCGQVSVSGFIRQLTLARGQRQLFDRYQAIVVASRHMKTEYVRNGVPAKRVQVNPLFSTAEGSSAGAPDAPPHSVAFCGRMTTLKGGDLLVRAVADASSQLATPIQLTMIGDGPQRGVWERLATRLSVAATFTGWQSGDARWDWLRRASLLAVPSSWPEPFGLVGLEASALGVPAIAFDVGGIREWLTPGENGYLVPGNPPRASALAAGLVAAFREPDALRALRKTAPAAARRLSLARHLDRLEATLAQHAMPPSRARLDR